MNILSIAAFVRTLTSVAPLISDRAGGLVKIGEVGAALIEAGADGLTRLDALTAEMKRRQEADITTTAEEILADVERVQALDQQIQDTAQD